MRTRADSPNKTCTTNGCTNPLRARGLCSTHYNQQHQPGRHKPTREVCSVCDTLCLKGRSRARVVCSTACRWFLQTPHHSTPVWFPACQSCGHRFSSRTPDAQWCSTPCKADRVRTAWPTCRIFIASCSICRRTFSSRYTVSTCSEDCAETKRRNDKREHRHRRRARARAAYVAPVSPQAVFERDGWRCHLCHKAVRRQAIVPDPLAPTLDHVIPLSKDGTHEPANVRTAHYRCNVRKGNRFALAGEQLMLFG